MRRFLKASAAAVFSSLIAPHETPAQSVVNLSGRYICVRGCLIGTPAPPAYITQNGWDMNIVNEVGMPSRAWIDWPGHIWIPNFHEGAIYSPDGMVIQFDHGTVWRRDIGIPPPPPPPSRRR